MKTYLFNNLKFKAKCLNHSMVTEREGHDPLHGGTLNKYAIFEYDDNLFHLSLTERNGKVANAGYDEMACIYTILPSGCDFSFKAKIKVSSFLPNAGEVNFQEAFGVFLRDTMKLDPFSGYPYSNMIAVGGYNGCYTIYGRNSVKPRMDCFPETLSMNSHGEDPAKYAVSPKSPKTFIITVTRTGERLEISMRSPLGFDALKHADRAETGALAQAVRQSGGTYTVDLPKDLLTSVEPEAFYLGFLAARGSDFSIEKSSVELKTETDLEAFWKKHQEASNAGWSGAGSAAAEKLLKFPARNASSGSLPSIWVSPEGKEGSAGTEDDETDLKTAIARCKEGQEIRLKSGVYKLQTGLLIPADNCGIKEFPKVLSGPDAGEPAVLDLCESSTGLDIYGSYWIIRNLSATGGMGIRIRGDHNTVTNCCSYKNLETGILIQAENNDVAVKDWPAFNTVENCVSFLNRDITGQNADGFAAKVLSGEGNVFKSCVSFLNTDDGFDLFSKAVKTGAVKLTGCVSVLNGYGLDAEGKLTATPGNGNGFKLGGSGLCVEHSAQSCIAAGNRMAGFTSNSNPYFCLKDCTSFNNKDGNIVYWYSAPSAVINKTVQNCTVCSAPEISPQDILDMVIEYSESIPGLKGVIPRNR